MAYNTGNPLGSTDPRDLRDNSENIDVMLNSTTETSHPDRIGTSRKTWHGMEVEHDAQIVAHEAEFQDRIAGMAFTRVGTFSAGFTLTDSREVLLYETDGHEYGWTGAFHKVVPPASTPAGTGGVGAGAWVDRTDVTLRSDLNVVVKVFESVADMKADATLIVGQKCRTLGYYSVGDGGGNDYEIVAAATGTDDGGSYIDLSGSGFQAKGLFGSVVNVKQFGAKGDGIADDTVTISNAFASIQSNVIVKIPPGIYLASSSVDMSSDFDVLIDAYSATVKWVGVNNYIYPLFVSSSTLGKVSINGATIDGNGSLQRAIESECDLNVSECEIINLWSETTAAIGISFSPSNRKILNVNNCKFTEFYGRVDGAIGDPAGATRAIYSNRVTLDEGCEISIKGCYFNNIFGREGDILQFDDNRVDTTASENFVIVSECYFGYSNRRAIKNRYGNVKVSNCIFSTIDSSHPEYARDGEGGAGIISLGDIGSNNTQKSSVDNCKFYNRGGIKASVISNQGFVSISNNIMYSLVQAQTLAANPIKIDGSNGSKCTISNNYMEFSGEGEISIYEGDSISIENNVVVNKYARYMCKPIPSDGGAWLIKGNSWHVDSSASAINNGIIGVESSTVSTPTADFHVSLIGNAITHEENSGYRVVAIASTGGFYPYYTIVGNTLDKDSGYLIFRGDTSNWYGSAFGGNILSSGAVSGWNASWGDNLLTNSYLNTDATGWTLIDCVYDSAEKSISVDRTSGAFYIRQTLAGAITSGTYKLCIEFINADEPKFNIGFGDLTITDAYNKSYSGYSSGYKEFIVNIGTPSLNTDRFEVRYNSVTVGAKKFKIKTIELRKSVY